MHIEKRQYPPRLARIPKRQRELTYPDSPRISLSSLAVLRARLSERLNALPGVWRTPRGPGPEEAQTFFIDSDYTLGHPEFYPYVLCHYANSHIAFGPLRKQDMDDVLHAEWGWLGENGLTLHAPRTVAEVDLIWRIFLLAYRHATAASAATRIKPRQRMHEHKPEPYIL